jgi:hypothetical protein
MAIAELVSACAWTYHAPMLGFSRPGSTLACARLHVVVSLALLGCGAHEGSRAEQTGHGDAESVEAEHEAGVQPGEAGAQVADARVASGQPDAAQIINLTPTCGVSQLTESGELPVACPDAGRADAGLADAAARGDASADASARSDAGPCGREGCALEAAVPDAAAPDAAVGDAGFYGPCAETQRDCSLAYFEVQLPATCSLSSGFGGDNLAVRFQACEACNKTGTLNQHYVRIKDCDGCEQVYASTVGSSYRTTGRGCRDLSMTNVELGNTEANRSCIDVYAGVGSATIVDITDGLHTVRVCRCNRQTGSCVRCNATTCDEM